MKNRSKLIWRLITIAAVVFLLFSGVYFLFSSTSDSKRLEQELIDRFGWAEQFVPVADGSIPPERLERFIRVRQAVQPACKDYQDVLDGIVGLAAIETEPEVSGSEAATRGIRGFKSVFNVGPRMLQFMDARNSTLMSEGMGLGEYIYLYLTAYWEQLADVASSPYFEMEEAHISSRTKEEFIQMLDNQLSALGSAGPDEVRAGLKEEIAALGESSDAVPWARGLLPNTRKSLSPHQDQLSGLYCDGVVGIELLQKNRGFGFWVRP
jgi:hypothetical protein